MRAFATILAFLALGGCSLFPGGDRFAGVLSAFGRDPECPILVDYLDVEEDQLAVELTEAPASAVWPRMIRDYEAQRAQLKAACEVATG